MIPSAPALGSSPNSPARKALGLLLAGLPAVVMAVAFGTTLVVGSRRPLAEDYGKEATRLIRNGDSAGALVCFKRLLTLEPGRDDLRYRMVIALDQTGQSDQAVALARSIAPTNRAGYPPAHYWLARRLLGDRSRLGDYKDEIEGHLLRFLQVFPDLAEAKAMLGTLYSETGRPALARPLLEATAGTEPDRLLELAQVRKDLGDRVAGLEITRRAMSEARRRAEARPDDKLAIFLWAKACADLEDYPEAIRVLEKGRKLTGDPAFDRSLAAICASWATSISRTKGRAGDRLAILQRGLKYDGSNDNLLGQIGGFLTAGGEDADEARAAVRGALASGQSPALAHFLLGNDAWARDQPEEARNHWEQANRLDPRTPFVANNLAWILANREPIDLPRAEALIGQAIAQSPNDPRLHGTRGEILVKLGRWKDAVAEIEAALSGGANTPALHAALATAYEKLGMAEMAAEHRKP